MIGILGYNFCRDEDCLNQFKSEYTIDNNSIEFLPAYFNFIECFFA